MCAGTIAIAMAATIWNNWNCSGSAILNVWELRSKFQRKISNGSVWTFTGRVWWVHIEFVAYLLYVAQVLCPAVVSAKKSAHDQRNTIVPQTVMRVQVLLWKITVHLIDVDFNLRYKRYWYREQNKLLALVCFFLFDTLHYASKFWLKTDSKM